MKNSFANRLSTTRMLRPALASPLAQKSPLGPAPMIRQSTFDSLSVGVGMLRKDVGEKLERRTDQGAC